MHDAFCQDNLVQINGHEQKKQRFLFYKDVTKTARHPCPLGLLSSPTANLRERKKQRQAETRCPLSITR